MESAIPPALQCPRSRARAISDDFVPPYPAWTARASEVGQVVMGYFGVQAHSPDAHPAAESALAHIVRDFARDDGPVRHDLAFYVDPQGFATWIAIAYWLSPASFEQWRSQPDLAAWWSAPERLQGGVGYFREILSPQPDAYETLFSSADVLEGVGAAMGARSTEDIQEHAYWGSMRDRLPLSQTDPLAGQGDLAIGAGTPGYGHRVRVRGHHHLAVIRSGQDWSATAGRERELYVAEMEPALHAGMAFLNDAGPAIGCYANRYLRCCDPNGAALEQSFGTSYWRSLAAMEDWSAAHPSHLAIFDTFMRIVQELNFAVQLRLYHEVSVLTPDQQDYEYVNCHAKTGLLNALLL